MGWIRPITIFGLKAHKKECSIHSETLSGKWSNRFYIQMYQCINDIGWKQSAPPLLKFELNCIRKGEFERFIICSTKCLTNFFKTLQVFDFFASIYKECFMVLIQCVDLSTKLYNYVIYYIQVEKIEEKW